MSFSSRNRAPVLGREKDLEVLAGSLDGPDQLVTLVGPGGIGKTTLAFELATKLATERGARLVVVDLERAATHAELCDRVVAACGTDAGEPHAAIDALGAAVILLDDFDGLVSPAALTIREWVERCAEAAFIVTSRERLGISGESVYEVGPIDHGAARTLLVETARRASIGFGPRPEDGVALAEIAAMLEGVPLALELAAARLPLVGVRALAEELRAGLALERRGRGGPERHASIATAVRGSWETLAPTEREALAQLTVFRGGFTVESVRAVVHVAPGRDPADALDLLRARSLVRGRDFGAARFDLYGQVRDFVVAACPEPATAAAARHASWFVAAAEQNALRAHTDASARAWLAAERENVLEVARRVLASGGNPAGSATPTAAQANAALRAIVAMKEVLLARGPAAELTALVSPLVDRTRDSGADPKLSARVMLLRGALRRERGDVRASLKDLLGAESVARAVRDELLGAEAALELGRTLRAGGELEPARQTFDRAARVFGDSGARVHEAEAIALAGAVAGEQGDLSLARQLCERAVALAGDDRLVGAQLWLVLARACAELGDRSSARHAAGEAERRAGDDGDHATAGRARVLEALVLHDAGDVDAASVDLMVARDLFVTNGLAVDAALASGHLGAIAREQGRSAAAYAALSDARDVALRARLPAHAAYFGAHLAGIEAALGRDDVARHVLDRVTLDRELDRWWPLSAAEVIAAQRAGRPSGTGLFARIFARSFAAHVPVEPPPSDDALVVGSGGAWFRPPRGARVGLERRRSLALLLDHLATARLERPGTTSRPAALFAAAWPGEKAIAAAAAHRVRVAVATLRKMGLREALLTTPDGYALSANMDLVRG